MSDVLSLGNGTAELTLAVVRRPTHQNKMSIAITAIDIALFIDLKPDPRVAQGSGNISAAVAGDPRFADPDSFGIIDVHQPAPSKAAAGLQRPRQKGASSCQFCSGKRRLLVIKRSGKCTRVSASRLVRADVQSSAYSEGEYSVRRNNAKIG